MQPAKGAVTIFVSVSNPFERDRLVKRIYKNLTTEPDTRFLVVQDQCNRIKVFHNGDEGVRVLLRTYLVVIIPIIMDLNPVYSTYGDVDFHLEETIKRLQSLTSNLQALQGQDATHQPNQTLSDPLHSEKRSSSVRPSSTNLT